MLFAIKFSSPVGIIARKFYGLFHADLFYLIKYFISTKIDWINGGLTGRLCS